jgi:hypothetical protein
MELFQVPCSTMPVPLFHPDVCFSQSSLLKYREFKPLEYPECSPAPEPRAIPNPISSQGRTRPSKWWPFRASSRSRVDLREPSQSETLRAREKPPTRLVKKMPVFFLDEAHKLYVFPFLPTNSSNRHFQSWSYPVC